MDLLRAALGDDKLSYLGFSYGTRIGAKYAEMFPRKGSSHGARRRVDPAVDPMQSVLDQFESFQKVFDDYAADCAKAPDCPLGTDPTKAVERFHVLVDPLVDSPAPTTDPRGLSYNDAVTGVFNALYLPEHWRHLTTWPDRVARWQAARRRCWRSPTTTRGRDSERPL